jgi:Transcriptional Coactivator p15 (PC4)
MSEFPIVAHTVEKNVLEEVQVALSEFKGHPLVDVQTFASFDDRQAEKRATKKGVSLKVERLPDLVEGLNVALNLARAKGLLPDR